MRRRAVVVITGLVDFCSTLWSKVIVKCCAGSGRSPPGELAPKPSNEIFADRLPLKTEGAVGERWEEGVALGDSWEGVDAEALGWAARVQAVRSVDGTEDMACYLATQVSDDSRREVVGPLFDGGGTSGVVLRRGVVVAAWGEPVRE